MIVKATFRGQQPVRGFQPGEQYDVRLRGMSVCPVRRLTSGKERSIVYATLSQFVRDWEVHSTDTTEDKFLPPGT